MVMAMLIIKIFGYPKVLYLIQRAGCRGGLMHQECFVSYWLGRTNHILGVEICICYDLNGRGEAPGVG